MEIAIIGRVLISESQIKKLKMLGNVSIYNKRLMNANDLIQLIKNINILIITAWVGITREVLKNSKNLKMISVWSTGYDNVDLGAATKHGIIVSNAPAYGTSAVSEHVFALILALSKKLIPIRKDIQKGNWLWGKCRNILLKDKTLGIVGVGRIGSKVAKLASVFEMKIIALNQYTSNKKDVADLDIEYVDLPDLMKKSDIISIHLPLIRNTKKIIGKKELSLMKKDALLINTARGKLIDEKELIKILKENKIAGAGLDCLDKEPPEKDNPLLKMERVIITPHSAVHDDESMWLCTEICIENVKKFIDGRPQNVVN